MTEMIERVARALARRMLLQAVKGGLVSEYGSDIEAAMVVPEVVDDLWPDYVDDARAAIEAMREPTVEMWGAGVFALERDQHSQPKGAWQAMIDEALRGG